MLYYNNNIILIIGINFFSKGSFFRKNLVIFNAIFARSNNEIKLNIKKDFLNLFDGMRKKHFQRTGELVEAEFQFVYDASVISFADELKHAMA